MWTDAFPPDSKLPNAQVSTWLPIAPAIEQVPGPLYAGLIVQLISVPLGSGSLSPTPFTEPGPALLTMIVIPTGVPAATDAASGVLVAASCPLVVGGYATTTSVSCLVLPPIPASTGSVGVKNVVMSNS